jgi:GH15 family glucan-1,4-alpha-glucosidase
MIPAPEYLPIADYGAIGNLRTVALVGRTGSIDWCCLPHLDSPSVFAALLDRRQGGRFRVSPAGGSGQGRQRYWPATNVLETTFDAPGGRLVVVDWMPLAGDIDGCGKSVGEPALCRQLVSAGGPVEVDLLWSPRPGYARSAPEIRRAAGGFLAEGPDGARLALAETFPNAVLLDDGSGPSIAARFRLEPGAPLLLATRWGCEDAELDLSALGGSLETTARVWRAWAGKEQAARVREWAAADPELIQRSELALRLLMHGDTGGIAAAATTSLPEDVGGERNWDYRYVWVRDSAQLVETLYPLHHRAEIEDFMAFIERVSRHRGSDGSIQLMYGLHGERDCPERTLDHLEGYRGSRPVRVGNGAFHQTQHDVYGEILNSAYELARRGVPPEPEMRPFLARAADQACEQWRQPDHGIWEMPGEPQHFVYTKLLVWVALDRAVLLAERFGLEGDVTRWCRERDLVKEDLLGRGYSPEARAFTQAYGSQELDAANLLIPKMELLPFDDPRCQGTIERTLEQLTEERLVYRYHADDGLEGDEGAFGLVSFWMVDALAFSGRLDEAHDHFEALLSHASPLGLFSEEFDPRSGEQLGNMPQAFSHVGLIDSALHLAWVRDGGGPIPPPMGSDQHRREVGRTQTYSLGATITRPVG